MSDELKSNVPGFSVDKHIAEARQIGEDIGKAYARVPPEPVTDRKSPHYGCIRLGPGIYRKPDGGPRLDVDEILAVVMLPIDDRTRHGLIEKLRAQHPTADIVVGGRVLEQPKGEGP